MDSKAWEERSRKMSSRLELRDERLMSRPSTGIKSSEIRRTHRPYSQPHLQPQTPPHTHPTFTYPLSKLTRPFHTLLHRPRPVQQRIDEFEGRFYALC